jgi:hypothetical protein
VSQYRDPLAGLRSQVATKRASLADRERAISPLVRAMLPTELTRTMTDLGARADAPGDDLAALSDRDVALDALLAAYDEAVALAPKLTELPNEVRDPPRPELPPPWLFEEPDVVHFKRALTEHLQTIADDEAWLVRWGDYGYLSRIRVKGAPVIVLVQAKLSGMFASSIRTSIPAGVPRLEVRRESAYDAIGRAMRLRKEIALGDEVFDEVFWISGDEATATLLVPAARRALLALSAHAPSLFVGAGLVETAFTGPSRHEINAVLPDAAVSAVLAIRNAVA